MPYLLPLPAREQIPQHFAFKEDLFTDEECDKILALAEAKGWERARTAGGDVDVRRRSFVSWLEWVPDHNWLFERLSAASVGINAQFWGFDLTAFGEPLQITKYDSQERGHYTWHQDVGGGSMSIRKLSFVVQLTDPETYTGGELELFMGKLEKHLPVPKKRGSCTWFPAFEPHRVTPMKSGVRNSLVGWISGHPFR